MLPNVIQLNRPDILDEARCLPAQGSTRLTTDNLFYLNVDDRYIHQLFPKLEDTLIKKADYFSGESIGAHITIIYPEETKKIDFGDLTQEHHFIVKDAVVAEIGYKSYYALLVESPSLLALRKKYQLPELLSFKGYSIGFHITIATLIK